MMNNLKRINKYLRIMSVVLAILTVIVAVLFIWQALDIYLTGISTANQPSPGVYIEPVYSAASISAHFSEIAPVVFIWLSLCLAMLVLRVCFPEQQESYDINKIKKWREQELKRSESKKRFSRRNIILVGFIIAGTMILFGIYNGGMWDVFVKAVNICTECVGLG